MVKLTDTTIDIQDTSEVVYADAHSHLVPDWFELEEVEKIVANAQKVIGAVAKCCSAES